MPASTNLSGEIGRTRGVRDQARAAVAGALALVCASAPTPAHAQAPEPEGVAPGAELQSWRQKRHSLQVVTGLSGGFMAAMFVTGAAMVAWLFWPRHSDCFDCEGDAFGESLTAMVMLPSAALLAIPTGIFGARLRRHERERPSARLRLAPGGLQIQF